MRASAGGEEETPSRRLTECGLQTERKGKMQYITEQEIDRITTDTCLALAKEPKTTVTISVDGGREYWEGGINGHFFRIRTGTPVQVPESLARQIALSANVLRESESRLRAYRKGGGKKVL